MKDKIKTSLLTNLSLPVKVGGFLILFGIAGLTGWLINGKTPIKTASGIKNEDRFTGYVRAEISGAIRNPGWYKIKKGAIIGQLVDKAGGLSDDADLSGINLAGIVKDRQKINVPHMPNKRRKAGIGKGPGESYINPPLVIKKID